ncbi:MAG: plasmid maintenance system antidote protein [Bacteroidota bacterium]|nr:plasmid maintenance system antidote protein [Bacteroidota bacterium]
MYAIDSNIAIIKGIHPGIILARELKKRELSKRSFALSINEYPQLLGDITKGKRRINPSLSIRIGKALGLDESFFSVLQAYYDIKHEKKKHSDFIHPDIKKFRPVVFWDTDIRTIDWEKNKPGVVRRIFERGNGQEINEIIRFYGRKEIIAVLKRAGGLSPTGKNNREKYL